MGEKAQPEARMDAHKLRAIMKSALHLPEGHSRSLAELREAAETDLELFFQTGMQLVESLPPGLEAEQMSARLFDVPEFLLELVRPGRFQLRELILTCQRLRALDDRLDIRLARLLPGRWEDDHDLSSDLILRILDVLDEISHGPRLILMLSHLTSHRDPKVAGSATRVVAKRVRNWGWTQRHLESGGAEVRAGVVESLWGLDTPSARRTMRACLQDASERVVGNAVFGLHLLNEEDVIKEVEWMAADERPAFRSTAAWLAGQIGRPEFELLLEHARHDAASTVRLAAKQAMVARKQAEAAAKEAAEKAAAANCPSETTAQDDAPKQKARPAKPATPSEKFGQTSRKAREHELRLHLDGSTTKTSWD